MTRATLAIGDSALSISGVLDFESVLAIDEPGRQWLAASAPEQCELDLAGVAYSSSVGVALVLGWLRAAQRAGRTLAVTHMPADMLALVRVGGLEGMLEGS